MHNIYLKIKNQIIIYNYNNNKKKQDAIINKRLSQGKNIFELFFYKLFYINLQKILILKKTYLKLTKIFFIYI